MALPIDAAVEYASKCRFVQVVEFSTGQMVEDVRLAINGKTPVEFYGRAGGNVPSADEIHTQLLSHEAVHV